MPYEIPLHEHGFWHLDLVRTGKITAFGEDWTRELPPGGGDPVAGGLPSWLSLWVGREDVADQMGFPDPFTFSRFFKRVTGENPRDYRKRMR